MKKKAPGDAAGGAAANLYLFYGDELLAKEQVDAVTAEFLEPELRATNLVVLDGANLDPAELSSHLHTPTLFGARRVVVVDRTAVFMGKVDKAALLDKVLANWKKNNSKAAHRALGQLLDVLGLEIRDLSSGDEWLDEIYRGSSGTRETETLRRVAESFLDSGASTPPKAGEALIEELLGTDLPEDAALIFTAPGVDKRKRLFKLFEKRGRVVDCSVRRERFGSDMEKGFFGDRVKEILGRSGKKVSSSALAKMYKRSGKEMRRLNSELEKLVAYLGDREEVTPNDVDAVFSDFHQAAYFELSRALRTADLSKCLPALHENLKIVDHPLQTLAGMANEFRRLLVARELLFTVFRPHWRRGITFQQFQPILREILKERPDLKGKGAFNILKMKEYAVYNYLLDAQRFPMEKLIGIMEAILEADIMMKSTRIGSTSPGTIVENLVMKICDRSPGRRTSRRPGGRGR
jgi:DNA polymerase-3 subunit delta